MSQPKFMLAPETSSRSQSLNRREFIRLCSLAAAAVGLPLSAAAEMVEAVTGSKRPSVIWLHFQECTGCTESLLRSTHPDLAELILDLISLDYHETLFAAAGHQAEEALQTAMEKNAGKYVCIVEGAIPTKDGGIYCKIGGRTALEILKTVAEKAGAIIAIGSCASFGGIPAADPDPTGARSAREVLPGKTVVSIPGCPANPYNLLGTVLQFATFGTLPALDSKGRPKFAYARVIHEDCPRRAHFDNGRFAQAFGDAGHREGWCLYKLGCKGPETYANCSTIGFGDVGESNWPVACGHPCIGCSEQGVGFAKPIHATAKLVGMSPPAGYPQVAEQQGQTSFAAAAALAAIAGAAAGATAMLARNLGQSAADTPAPTPKEG